MEINTKINKNWLIISFEGKLNEHTSKDVIKEIDSQLEKGNKNIILDFKEISFINSSGLGSLISMSKRITQKQGSFRLINIQPFILDIFNITKLNNVFSIFKSEDEAVS